MKLNRLFYFLSFLIAFSWTSHAMEDPAKDQNPLEALKNIVREAFPPLIYEGKEDLDYDEYIKFQKPSTTSEDFGLFSMLSTNLSSMISGFFQKPNSNLICTLPKELLFIISDFLDPQSLGRLGVTSSFIRTTFQLNNYCLQEAMPHAIPIDILVRKTKNTKDGVFKLANLYSVSDRDLLAWFGQPYLEEILAAKGGFPTTLCDKTEEQLQALYPLFKVKMAAALPETDKPAWMTDILGLFTSYIPNKTKSFGIMRLATLTARGKFDLFSLLHEHLLPRARIQERSPNSNYQAFDIVARDLLMARHRVATVNNTKLYK